MRTNLPGVNLRLRASTTSLQAAAVNIQDVEIPYHPCMGRTENLPTTRMVDFYSKCRGYTPYMDAMGMYLVNLSKIIRIQNNYNINSSLF